MGWAFAGHDDLVHGHQPGSALRLAPHAPPCLTCGVVGRPVPLNDAQGQPRAALRGAPLAEDALEHRLKVARGKGGEKPHSSQRKGDDRGHPLVSEEGVGVENSAVAAQRDDCVHVPGLALGAAERLGPATG